MNEKEPPVISEDDATRQLPDRWRRWASRSTGRRARVALIAAPGFADIELVPGGDVFAGAPQQSGAADLGTRGAGIRARR